MQMADARAKTYQSLRQAARQILLQIGSPLKPDELIQRALDAGLIATTGKTPTASMAAQLYTEIQQHGDSSVFVKAGKGRFGLRAWVQSPGPVPKASTRTAKIVPIVADPLETLVAEVLTAQYE